MDKIKIGVIGSGYWGPNLIRNFFEIPSSEVVCVVDLRKERLDAIHALYPNICVSQDYHDLFTMNLDAAIIATPPATHYSIAKECLEHGLSVLVEKPLTLISAHAEELIALADSRHLVLMVGHIFTFNSAVQALKELVASGELGEIYYADAARLNLGLFQKDINVLWDLAPHDVSILMYILDQKPINASAHGMPCVFDSIQDVAYINLEFPKNILAHIHVSWLDPCKVRRITIVGSKKMVVYNDLSSVEKIRIYDKGVEMPEYTRNFGEFQCSYHYGDVTIPNIRFVEPLRQECQHFLDCVKNGTQPITSGVQGWEVVKVLEAAQSSLLNSGHKEGIQW
jgi:predicted dehydrogenase